MGAEVGEASRRGEPSIVVFKGQHNKVNMYALTYVSIASVIVRSRKFCQRYVVASIFGGFGCVCNRKAQKGAIQGENIRFGWIGMKLNGLGRKS